MTSLRNIEPKLVVKLQPFGTERVIPNMKHALKSSIFTLHKPLSSTVHKASYKAKNLGGFPIENFTARHK